MPRKPQDFLPIAEKLRRRADELVKTASELEIAKSLRDRLDHAVDEIPERAAATFEYAAQRLHSLSGASAFTAGVTGRRVPSELNAGGIVFPSDRSTAPMAVPVLAALEQACEGFVSDDPRSERQLRFWSNRLWHRNAIPVANEIAAVLSVAKTLTSSESTILIEDRIGWQSDEEISLGALLQDVATDVRVVNDFQDSNSQPLHSALQDSRPPVAAWVLDDGDAVIDKLRNLRSALPRGAEVLVWARRTWPADPGLEGIGKLHLEALFQAGASTVIMPTAQLLAGPAAAVIIGRYAAQVGQVEEAHRVANRTALGIVAALRTWCDSELRGRIPLIEALGRSGENVRHRAKQLCILLEASPTIADAQYEEASIRLWPDSVTTIPSIRLRLRHSIWAPQRWAKQLATSFPRVTVEIDGPALLVDLKLIEPSQDVTLARLLLGGEREKNGDSAEPNVQG